MQRILDFELALDGDAAEQVAEHEWGASFLSRSIPMVWDANWVLVERPGMGAAEIEALADELIGGAGMEHRSVFFRDLDEAARLVAGVRGARLERRARRRDGPAHARPTAAPRSRSRRWARRRSRGCGES